MPYIHTDIFTLQRPKKPGNPCGDVIGYKYDVDATTIILADGLGAGIKANIAAEMIVPRFLGLVQNGASLREAFSLLVKTMNSSWGQHQVFSVFSVARILNNGNTTILSYDSPPPLLITKNYAKVLNDRIYTLEKAVICESTSTLSINESLLLMSDGITQAGMGKGSINGWESEGVAKFINKKLKITGLNSQDLLSNILNESKSRWKEHQGDDSSLLLAKNRRGIIVNLLSGAPINKSSDRTYINDFLNSKGIKIACGGTTAQILAREMKLELEANHDFNSSITPPAYKIEGINLVTEGVVTLNQVYNLLDEDLIEDDEDSPVFELLNFLQMADRVNIFTGKSNNSVGGNIAFKQQGILPRKKVIQRIKERLIEQGKLVVSYEY